MPSPAPTNASTTKARSRKRREDKNAAKAEVAARDSRKQVATPSGTATSAARVRGTVRDQVTTRPSDTKTVATPGTPTSPPTSRPGIRSRARTGSRANLAGSTVSSTPKTSSDIASQPRVRVAYADTVTSAVRAVEVNRSPISPASTASTTPRA